MSASTEARDELLRLRDDAERYRFWRRILLRRPERAKNGAPIYRTVVETVGEIDEDELDRILDECRRTDDGTMTAFAAGEQATNGEPVGVLDAPRGTSKVRVYRAKPCAKPTCGKTFQPTGPRAAFCEECR